MAHSALRFIRSEVARHFFRFCVVGGLGFAVNAAILLSLTHLLSVPFYLAQIIGAETALLTNFTLHDFWTFDGMAKAHVSKRRRLIMYHGMFLFGMAVNSLTTILVHYLWDMPGLFALAVGSAVALTINFLTSRLIVWRSASSQE